MHFGNGLTTTRQHDDKGHLSQINTTKTLALKYRYDAKGNIAGIDSDHSASRYRYDTLNRLSEATTDKRSWQYDYDKVGNRTGTTTDDATQSLGYDKKQGNRLANINGQALAYNAEGSATEIPSPQGTRRYEYNAEQRPVGLYIDGNLIAKYAYNGFGERIKKVVYANEKGKDTDKGKVTYYLYDGRSLTAEANASGEVTQQYVMHQNTPAILLEGSTPYYLHTDHLGTPRLVTDEDQKTVWQANYTPFGDAEITINLRFPGQYADQESGTYYNYFRDYDPETGRYVTSDPIGFAGGLNTYAYVGGNPINHVDPLGLYDIFIGGNNDDDTNIVSSYATDFSDVRPDRNMRYFTWNQQSQIIALVNEIKSKCGDDEPINIIGHSWGGTTSMLRPLIQTELILLLASEGSGVTGRKAERMTIIPLTPITGTLVH